MKTLDAYVTPSGAVTLAKATRPSACVPLSAKVVSYGPGQADVEGLQPAEAETKAAPIGHTAHFATPPKEYVPVEQGVQADAPVPE